MSRLDELIEELCPDGVEFELLGNVLKNNNASNCIPKKNYKKIGKIPIIDQSQSYIAGYTDDESAVPPVLPCIIFGDHTRVVKYADQKFAQGDSGTKVFIPVGKNLITKYVYYVFSNLDIPSRGYNRHWIIVKNIPIPLPPLPVQQEIVRILDNFTELTTELTAQLKTEIEARKKQYECYRDRLLSQEELNKLCPDGMEFVTVEEICDITRGRVLSKNYLRDNIGDYPVYSSQTVNNGVFGYINTYDYDCESITWTTDGANAGSVFYHINEKFSITNVCGLLRVKNNEIVSTKFLFYVLQVYAKKYVNDGMGNPKLMSNVMAEISIPLPPLPVQQEIVRILDNFVESITELTAKLETELEARQKQYEYYRDKLLSFKEVSS